MNFRKSEERRLRGLLNDIDWMLKEIKTLELTESQQVRISKIRMRKEEVLSLMNAVQEMNDQKKVADRVMNAVQRQIGGKK